MVIFFSTSVGSTVGLILGETLAEFIGQDDNYYFSQETLRILEINDNNNSTVTGYWKNPKSRNEGVIRIKGFYGNSDCRLIEHIYVNDSSGPKNNFRTACREESGKWAMIKNNLSLFFALNLLYHNCYDNYLASKKLEYFS